MATVPPTQISPGPSCWPRRWRWLGLGNAGGICQGWPASKFHHLEWAEEKRISKKHLQAVKSLNGTGHHSFSFTVATNWMLKNHPVINKFSLTSNRFSTNLQSFSLFYILTLLQSPQISPHPYHSQQMTLHLILRENRSHYARTHPTLCTSPHIYFFKIPLISQWKTCSSLPKLNAHTECEILRCLHS